MSDFTFIIIEFISMLIFFTAIDNSTTEFRVTKKSVFIAILATIIIFFLEKLFYFYFTN